MRIWIGDRDGGRLVDPDEARIGVLDHGLTVGDGVFETLKTIGPAPFALTRHLRRLAASASAMGLAAPDPLVIREAVETVLADDGVGPQGRLRITYTGGTGPLGSDRGDAVPSLILMAAESAPWPDTTSVATVPWVRNERSPIAGVKTTSYAENVIALQSAHERGCSEAVLANSAGSLCEGTGTNVFVVVNGQLRTPSLASGCLAGITRELVIEWFGATEIDMPLAVLQSADEVLLTSSTRDVHPVVRVDDRVWSEAGPIGRELRAQFAARAAADLDP